MLFFRIILLKMTLLKMILLRSILSIFRIVKGDFMTNSKLPFEGDTPSAEDVLHTLIRTAHHLHRQFEIYLSELDIPQPLTGSRIRLLLAVAESGTVRINELATKLGIQARTVSQTVDALEQENLLVRLPDPDDRRAVLLQLTNIAQPQIEKARMIVKEAAEKVLEHLPLEQRSHVLNTLLRLTNKAH